MSDIHITSDVLEAVTRGKLPARVLAEAGWQHLMALCPFCRSEFEAWRRGRSAAVAYGTAVRMLPHIVEKEAGDLPRKQRSAGRDLRALLELPHEERLHKIRRATARFRGPALVRLLLAEARRHMPADLRASFELAETAQTILNHSPAGPEVPGLHARAAAIMGNALRGLGDLSEAERRFAVARHIITHGGVLDSLVYAEVDWLEGILCKDQRRFADAEELLVRAVTLYRLSGDDRSAARPLVSLGLLAFDRQDYREAGEIFKVVLRILDPEAEPRLYGYARHNLALTLCEEGDYATAATLVAANKTLYQTYADSYTQSRLAWLEGRISAGLGHFEEAERAFLAIREHFLTADIGYDAAMVSLDLALLYLRQGRGTELRQLAEELRSIFTAEDLHQEARAALILFQDAVREERATVRLVEELAAYLKKVRSKPRESRSASP